MGKPMGVLVLTCICTHDRSVSMSMGTGLVIGTKLGTCTHTRGGFYPWVRPLEARVVRARVHEQAHIRADPYNEGRRWHDNCAITVIASLSLSLLSCLQEWAWCKRRNGTL